MPSPSVVETPRLLLRPPTAADRDAWLRLHRDPRTYRHAPHAMRQTDEDAVAFLDRTLANWDEQGIGFWLAEDRATREVVGVCGLVVVEDAFLNLYSRLVHERLGEGLGREMSRTCAAVALEYLPALPVRALVKEVNIPSVRTALATGFERVGTRVLDVDLPDEPPSTVFESRGRGARPRLGPAAAAHGGGRGVRRPDRHRVHGRRAAAIGRRRPRGRRLVPRPRLQPAARPHAHDLPRHDRS